MIASVCSNRAQTVSSVTALLFFFLCVCVCVCDGWGGGVLEEVSKINILLNFSLHY